MATKSEEIDCATMAPTKRTWLQRLFPARALILDPKREGFALGYVTVETYMVLDWKDRLRLLVSGKLHMTTKTFTDVPVDRAESESAVYVLPPNTHVPKPVRRVEEDPKVPYENFVDIN